jgi:hypothetical protein
LQSRLESGASVRLTIGSTKAWTLGAARDEARRLQVLIDSGIDPRQEKRDRIAAAEAKRAEAGAKRIERSASLRRHWKPGSSTSKRAPLGGVKAISATM